MRNLHLAGGMDGGGHIVHGPTKINQLKCAGYSADFLDRMDEPNGNILPPPPGGSKGGWDRLYSPSGMVLKSDSYDVLARSVLEQELLL